MSIDDYDIFACYQDLWKTKSEKRNITSDLILNLTPENVTQHSRIE